MKVLVFPNRFQNNPYFEEFNNSLKSAGMQTVRFAAVLLFRSRFDVVHFHFPDHIITQGNLPKSIVSTISVLSLTFYAKVTRRPITWMVHDVNPLLVRRKSALSIFMKVFKYCVDGYVFLSKSSQREFYNYNPGEQFKPCALIHISRYKNYSFDVAALQNLRKENHVGDGEILISILGDIKPRKGFQCIPLIPNETRDGIKVNLAICGQVDGINEESVENLLQSRPRTNFIRINRRLRDDELALWIRSSDAVLLPYIIGSNSSMAINVLSNYGRIISSDVPMFQEIKDYFGDSWIKTVDIKNKEMLEEVISNIPIWKTQPLDFDKLEASLRKGDPDQVGQLLSIFYGRLCIMLRA